MLLNKLWPNANRKLVEARVVLEVPISRIICWDCHRVSIRIYTIKIIPITRRIIIITISRLIWRGGLILIVMITLQGWWLLAAIPQILTTGLLKMREYHWTMTYLHSSFIIDFAKTFEQNHDSSSRSCCPEAQHYLLEVETASALEIWPHPWVFQSITKLPLTVL